MTSEKNRLTEDFAAFINQVAELKMQMDKIKSYKEFDRFDVSEVAGKSGKIRYLRQAAKELNDFVEFPEKKRDMGRPVKFPDSPQEKKLFAGYVKKGLSIRKIARETGISKDIINEKLKRYNLR